MIQITYNGVDITDDVSVNRCYHDMYAGVQSDTLRLRVNDVRHLWDSWGPAAGDEIKVDNGNASTGTMFLAAVKSKNGLFDLVAQSAPKSGYTKQRKAWRQVRLLQIGEEIAARNGLTFSSFGVTDRLYSYILQDDVGDLMFYHNRAQLEGCSIQVYDKRLILFSEPYLESTEPAETLELTDDGDYEYNPRQADLFGSCVVNGGQYSGTFGVENGSARVYRPDVFGGVGSDAEAERFAKGLLRAVNKGCMSGFVRLPLLTGYAAGSVVNLVNPRASSWDGPVFLDHVRNDYCRGKSKMFFHRVLEGY